jgi:hypothetical protein
MIYSVLPTFFDAYCLLIQAFRNFAHSAFLLIGNGITRSFFAVFDLETYLFQSISY